METNRNDQIINIAIADDDQFQLFILNSIIRRNNRFRLLFDATNGQDFINKLKFCNSLPDVCIIDLKMPFMDGAKTAEQIKKYNPIIKVIGYTTSTNLREIALMKESGAEDVVSKSNVRGLLDYILETCIIH